MTKTSKGEAKMDSLLEKGMEVMWSKGYNGTSVSDIVTAASVPKGSFYFYFDSKEDFALKALSRYSDTLQKPAIQLLSDESVSPKQRLLNYYEYRAQVVKEQFDCKMGCLACNLGSEMAEHNENIRKAVLDVQNKIKTLILQVAKEAQETGELDAKLDIKDLVEFIENAGKGALVTMREMKSSYPIDSLMNMIRTVILK